MPDQAGQRACPRAAKAENDVRIDSRFGLWCGYNDVTLAF